MKIRFSAILLLSFLIAGISLKAQVAYEMTVAKDGSGDYITIMDAIDATKAFPDKRITIYIKNGVYNEKVIIPSWNNKLSLIGEDAEKTIITYNDYFKKIDRGRNSTFMTYTMRVDADDFYAENLTIENTAGPVGQAVALHVEGNRCAFKNCKILGNQDTLYLNGENSHQFFYHCYIDGTTDFIFGSATAVFQNCTIHSKSDSYVTAASTTANQEFGFVFLNCQFSADINIEKVYLGRPWRNYAKTVFLNCDLGRHIRTEGWHDWSKEDAHQTVFYGEYNNIGAGSNTIGRVEWSHQLTKKEAKEYTPENVLGNWVTTFVNE